MDQSKTEQLKHYFINHPSSFDIDDITFNDLNLDTVFNRINKCRSSLGEEVLYSLLRQPLSDIDLLEDREKSIQRYIDDEKLKKDTLLALSKLSKVKKISVFKYLKSIEEINVQGFLYKNSAWLIMLICIFLLFINTTVGICAIIIGFFYNAITYFKKRALIKPYFICFSYLSKSLHLGKSIKYTDSEKYKKIGNLGKYFIFLGQMNGETVSGNNNPLDMILDIFRLGFHYDIIVFYNMVSKVKNNLDTIEATLYEIGLIDSYIAIGEYRKNADTYCIPKHVLSNKRYVRIDDLGHPLLKEPVRNSVSLDKSVLLTGCNASGKSTFLRSVALNIILSQTIHTCSASGYEAPIYLIITSMSIKDDLMSARSFYMAEVLSLKRIIDLLDSSPQNHVVTFVDEVLRGTNTIERIAASTEILKYLSEKSLCFAATHDIELTKYLDVDFSNYHFNEGFTNTDFSFDFILKEGPADTRNAIKLLEVKGFPEKIIKGANILANAFDSK